MPVSQTARVLAVGFSAHTSGNRDAISDASQDFIFCRFPSFRLGEDFCFIWRNGDKSLIDKQEMLIISLVMLKDD